MLLSVLPFSARAATCANAELEAGDLYAGGGEDVPGELLTTRNVRRGGVRGLVLSLFAIGVKIMGGLVLVLGVVTAGDWDEVEETWLESDGAWEVSSKWLLTYTYCASGLPESNDASE